MEPTHLEESRLKSRPEAASQMGISVRTLIRLEADGQLRVVRLRRRVLVPQDEIDRLIAGQKKRK